MKTFRIETKVMSARTYTVTASSDHEARRLFEKGGSKLVHFESDEDISEEIVECNEAEGAQ